MMAVAVELRDFTDHSAVLSDGEERVLGRKDFECLRDELLISRNQFKVAVHDGVVTLSSVCVVALEHASHLVATQTSSDTHTHASLACETTEARRQSDLSPSTWQSPQSPAQGRQRRGPRRRPHLAAREPVLLHGPRAIHHLQLPEGRDRGRRHTGSDGYHGRARDCPPYRAPAQRRIAGPIAWRIARSAPDTSWLAASLAFSSALSSQRQQWR